MYNLFDYIYVFLNIYVYIYIVCIEYDMSCDNLVFDNIFVFLNLSDFFLTKKAGSSDSCFRSPCLDISFSRKNVPSNVHGGYQYCQAGMSVDWAKNGDKMGKNVLISQ